MSWLYIEPDLTLWQNLQLRFWLLGMDLFDPLGGWRARGWRWRAYLYCVAEAGRVTYGSDPGEDESETRAFRGGSAAFPDEHRRATNDEGRDRGTLAEGRSWAEAGRG